MSGCDECGVNPANVHLTQIVDGATVVAHLCEECARKKGISISIAAENAVAENVKKVPTEKDVVCQSCAMRLSEFRARGWLGCSVCYETFSDEIDELLVQVHGSREHCGKRPKTGLAEATTSDNAEIVRLRDQLDKAVMDEEFELAAAIRDVIKGLVISDRKLQRQKG